MSMLAMPFIDNDLLWSSDHDGKMVDLSSCLQDASVAIGQQNQATGASGGLGELSQSDLSSLVPPIAESQMSDNDDIFKHLSDTTAIEIESILSEFSQTTYIKQEENNNMPSSCQNDNNHSGAEDPVSSSNGCHKSAHMLELRKYTIAAANPILAEKLSTPSDANLHPLGGAANRSTSQLALLTPKIEKDCGRLPKKPCQETMRMMKQLDQQ